MPDLRTDVRCPGKRQAVLIRPGVLEIKCDSRVCGAERGVVVLHRWDTNTGELMETQRYRDPVADNERK